LVFTGSLDRMFRAHDATTGAMLWSARLNDAPSAPPIAYAANNQEYVAVIVGPGGYQSLSYSALVPEIQNPADRNAMLWVFEVPTRGTAASTSAAR
jgi:alcohol dehydrogenase (cytochrome c)